MYKIYLSVLLCFSASLLLAQPIITMDNLLKIGDVVATQPCSTTNFQPGSAGANQNWDFSQLVPEGPQDTTFYINPAGTPYVANYPSSNIVARFGADGYGYYQITANRLFFWGQSDPSSALVLTDPAVYFKSPATYGSFVLDTISGSLNAAPLVGTVVGQAYFQGDGYGTLKTPDAQYNNVLRIRTTTVAVATVPFFGTIIDSIFNYSWYQPGIPTPVLEMIDDTQWTSGVTISKTQYVNFYRSLTTKTAEPNKRAALQVQVFPNPTNGSIQFSNVEKPARLIIRNVSGQVVMEENIAPNAPVNVEGLRAGVFFGTIMTDNTTPVLVKFVVSE